MNQHEWVAGCLAWYREADLVPGNPEDGVWEACHYPVPKCLGGTATVLLLKEHHAVQGVLQSEEYQRCCIWAWELAYLEGELLDLARKWKRTNLASARSARCYVDVAFEQLPTPVYWGDNPSAPKPILIHYRDGSDYYVESIKQASRVTQINQSTIQHRLKKSVVDQLNRPWC